MAFWKNEYEFVTTTGNNLKQEPSENITMTKKDFAEIADLLKTMDHIPEDYRKQFALAFVHFFQKRNERFNEVRFMAACGFNTSETEK